MLTKLLNLIAKSERIDQTNDGATISWRIGSERRSTPNGANVELRSNNGVIKVLHDGLEIGFLRDHDGDTVREAIWDRQRVIQANGLKLFLAS